MSAAAAIKLLAGKAGESRLATLYVPAFGAVALAAIISVDVVESDATTRAVELAGLALGIPFALWRGRRMHAAPIIFGTPQPAPD
jgi:hypothetical protein